MPLSTHISSRAISAPAGSLRHLTSFPWRLGVKLPDYEFFVCPASSYRFPRARTIHLLMMPHQEFVPERREGGRLRRDGGWKIVPPSLHLRLEA